MVDKLQKIIQDFECKQIIYFIEIERIYLIYHELQDQLGYYKTEFTALKNEFQQMEITYKEAIVRLER